MTCVYIVYKGIEYVDAVADIDSVREEIEKVFDQKNKAINYVSECSRAEVDRLAVESDYFVRFCPAQMEDVWKHVYAIRLADHGITEELYFRIDEREVE